MGILSPRAKADAAADSKGVSTKAKSLTVLNKSKATPVKEDVRIPEDDHEADMSEKLNREIKARYVKGGLFSLSSRL